MDKVTQQNAANAEESASASEEMNAQAQQMKSMVDELVTMVGGGSGKGNARTISYAPKSVLHHNHETSPQKAKNKHLVVHKTATHREIIPMDDHEFKDF